MKRRDLIRKIAAEAKRQRIGWEFDHEGARHTIYQLDGLIVPIPRHNEINEMTAEGIKKDCQEKLGKGWWR